MRKLLAVGLIALISVSFAFARGGHTEPDPDAGVVVDAFVISTGEWFDYTPENNRLVGSFSQMKYWMSNESIA